MKRVYIITGAAGHLAGTIIQYLRKTECEIRGLILPSENGESDSQITYYKGDITKPESLEEIFSGLSGAEVIVIHAAGLISIGSNITPQLPHSLSACLTADTKVPLSAFPSSHSCAGTAIKSQPDATNFCIIAFNSSISVLLSSCRYFSRLISFRIFSKSKLFCNLLKTMNGLL